MSHSQVFSITELFCEICWYLKHSSERGGSLASLALSSRRYLETALDVLWQEMPDMEPLLKLIPALVALEEESDYGQSVLYPLEKEDWVRFDYYASRIRILKIHHYGRIHCTVYSRLLQYKATPNLIPSLHSLTWYHDSPTKTFTTVALEISAFLTPSLQTLFVENCFDDFDDDADPPSNEDKESLELSFHMLTRHCPLIESLTLTSDTFGISSAFLSKFQNLTEVNLKVTLARAEALSIALKAMSGLPHLRKIIGLGLPNGPGIVSSTPSFPCLTHISVQDVSKGGQPTTFSPAHPSSPPSSLQLCEKSRYA
ncbi:hypothetical protein JAAARDRAFT_197553 [Jaapia argillacea MUCL 33604]|uniref:F-box domain-containing protein n=1 Tax=Jaapia argillacea MUCL 33604 TaxID=933084 RepID=A0A067PHU2_9AGAM|nr:hypothetical protein JAAARDRAFT_197553 [Jaapia argillacea MUCL 33604]